MNYIILILSCLVSFLASFFAITQFKKFFVTRGIIAVDQQKKEKPTLPQSGGIPVFFGFLIGIMFFVLLSAFYFQTNITLIIATTLSILIATLIGFFDDINISKEPVKNIYGDLEIRVGLPQWLKPLLTVLAAIPLIAIMAGDSTMAIPLIGTINFGVLYALLIVPILFVVITNSTNMLAGANGLEGGLMAIVMISLGIFSIINGRTEAAVISFMALFALAPYLLNNWYPAKMLPGDSLTYLFGATFASIAIIGNIESFALFIFIPWGIEIILKLRGKLKVRSLGNLQKDGTLKMPYKRIYSWTHIMMFLPTLFKRRFTEKQVTTSILLVEVMFCVLGFILFL
jgi:UDP-N-acetylglucosamine--dolichyl-phosphate N-acetylglucosaminephosphotransferase